LIGRRYSGRNHVGMGQKVLSEVVVPKNTAIPNSPEYVPRLQRRICSDERDWLADDFQAPEPSDRQ